MEDVSLNQLKTVCNLYLGSQYPYFEELREAFFLLDICGCRIEELFQIERWSYVGGDIVTLMPQKNNLQRTITLDEHTQNFKNCVINQTKPFLGRTSYQLQYLFRKLNPWLPIYSGGREISLYCYRYKHIWEAQAAGQTIEQIRIEMGHRTQTPILLYLAADINSTYYIEPYNPDPLPEGHIDPATLPIVFTGLGSYLPIDNPITGNTYTIHISVTDVIDSTVLPIAPYQYSTPERSLNLYVFKSPGVLKASLYVINTYTTPSNTGYVNVVTNDIARFTFVVTENLVQVGNYLSGTVNIKFYGNGVYYSQITFSYSTYALIRASKFLLNGRRKSNNTYQWQANFTLKSLYFWNRILSDAEILTLANQ